MKFIKIEYRTPERTYRIIFNMGTFYSASVKQKKILSIVSIDCIYSIGFETEDKCLHFYAVFWQVMTGDVSTVMFDGGFILRGSDE